jgi:methylated-DNA-protein-cysteine methyltransferase related protein
MVKIGTKNWRKRSKMPDFNDIYEVVKLIPHGRVTSYGAIAKYLGTGGARMVGWAMNAAHTLPDVPAHRVVNREGILTGKMHFKTPSTMENRLKEEGILVKDDQVLDFKSKFWDPTENL